MASDVRVIPSQEHIVGDETGKSLGVTADDLGRARDIANVEPLKTKTAQQTEVGDQYIDHGAVCDGKGLETPGCLFEDAQRTRLISDISTRIGDASTNYKNALTELRFEELIKKEADLHWAASIALDLVGAHLVKVAAKAVIALKSTGITKLSSHINGTYLNDNSFRSRAEDLLRAVDDKSIEGRVKTVFDPIKKGIASTGKRASNHENKTEKAATIAFIDQLKDSCDISFRKFGSHAAGHSNDAELAVIWEGMDPVNHTTGAYKAALSEKLSRFKKSGANDLGRKRAADRRFHQGDVIRDTRVVWLIENGSKTLYYQSHESGYNPNRLRRGDPDTGDLFGDEDEHLKFGDRNARVPSRYEGRVPGEFIDVALARSEEIWGPTPTIERTNPAPTRNIFVPDRRPQDQPRNIFVPDTGKPQAPKNIFVPDVPPKPKALATADDPIDLDAQDSTVVGR